MYCPWCKNNTNEDYNFCIVCGAINSCSELKPMSPMSESRCTEFQTSNDDTINEDKSQIIKYNVDCNSKSKHSKKYDKTTKCLIVSLALLVISAGILIAYDPSSNEELNDFYPNLTHDHEKYGEMKLFGDEDFNNGNFITSFDKEEERIHIALSDSIASQNNYFVWTLIDLNHTKYEGLLATEYEGNTVYKSEGKVFWTPSPGDYELSVICYYGDNYNLIEEKYSGKFRYTGNMEKEYDWTYDDKQFDVDLMFDYEIFSEYKKLEQNKRRLYNSTVDYEYISEFVVIDEVTKELSNQLESEYKKAYNLDRVILDQKYATFILTFVQICFDYPPLVGGLNGDEYMYGTPEYFVYPIETIFYGMGDCEDTSILCAALFSAAGFQSAIAIVPGHALAGVALENYIPELFSYSSYAVMNETIDGNTYYGCETTIDDGTMGIGIVGKTHSERIGEDHITLNKINRGKIGFYPITSF